ncbi:MAG: GNAT family N-acetyltransferase [Ignavibacteria bacterium]|nr:GNAT family N-acetyltransferase [Ignavibacteria bacterium]NCS80130.1 GNAT family N-acetyltransferase [Ignavibacteria bacterium]OIO17351.1 MAG: hypothetical protein AUJ54_09900 [Ignavibacteria bacterium CG1_02_37_35]
MNNLELRGCKNDSELLEVVNLCDAAFVETPHEYFQRHITKDNTLKYEDTRILIKDGVIVSSVQVFPRSIYVNKEKISFAGIGNVATHPTFRGKGFAATVLNDALEYSIKSGFDCSMLTTTLNRYYEKFGFNTVIRRKVCFSKLGNESPLIQVINFHEKIEELNSIYATYNENKVGPIVRNEDYWKSQYLFCDEDKKLFLALYKSNRIHAYIRAKIADDKVLILEFASLHNAQESFLVLSQQLAAKVQLHSFEMLLSDDELDNLGLLKSENFIQDKELMISFLNNDLKETVKNLLTQPNKITFHLTDFF